MHSSMVVRPLEFDSKSKADSFRQAWGRLPALLVGYFVWFFLLSFCLFVSLFLIYNGQFPSGLRSATVDRVPVWLEKWVWEHDYATGTTATLLLCYFVTLINLFLLVILSVVICLFPCCLCRCRHCYFATLFSFVLSFWLGIITL